MKRLVCALLWAGLLLLPSAAFAESAEDADEAARATIESGVEDILGGLELDELEALYNETSLSSRMSFKELISDMTSGGLSEITAEDALTTFFEAFKDALSGSAVYMAEIVILLLLCGLLKQLPSSPFGEGASRTAFFTGYIICAALAAGILTGSIVTAKNALDKLGAAADTLTPVLTALLTALGSLSSSAVMSPVLAALTGSVFTLIKSIVFPAIIVCAVLNLLTNISSAIKLDKLSGLVESGVKWFMGIVFIIFSGISALKGITGAAADGISFKTAKYTIDKAVPYIGGMFSDTLDTLMSCGILAKTAVGGAGLIIIALVMLAPLLSLVINGFLFRAGAAVAQPFADEACVGLLSGMARMVTLLFIVLLTCTAMVFILICLLLGAADMSFMLR